jgi:hypothetical protein
MSRFSNDSGRSATRDFVRARLLLLGALALTPGCSSMDEVVVSAKTLGLPPWQGEDRRLFGDELDPAALGLMPPSAPRKDQSLWLRAQQSELTARVEVRTFTLESTRGGTYKLGLRVIQPLAEATMQELEFEVSVDPGDPAYGLLKTQDALIQKRTYIGFFKRFAAPNDEVAVHFYMTVDSPEIAAVVQEAVALKEVNK